LETPPTFNLLESPTTASFQGLSFMHEQGEARLQLEWLMPVWKITRNVCMKFRHFGAVKHDRSSTGAVVARKKSAGQKPGAS
jgi:hypothetical protein